MAYPQFRWYHTVMHTYGAWLRGDSRGFRTRHHREHVEGDYKNPPPTGRYEDLERRSRELLKQPPVILSPEWRAIIGAAVKERLQGLGARLIVISMGGQHCHFLAQMPPEQARPWAGIAKKHAWFVARERGWADKLWAKRGKATPIENYNHQVNTFYYILRHLAQSAWVWSYRDEQS